MKYAAVIGFALFGLAACESGDTSRTYNMNTGFPTTKAGNLPATTSATNTTGGTQRLNPAHGQPGHRCDIPDGAPLPDNGTAPANTVATNTTPTTITPVTNNLTTTTVTPTSTKTAAGMNPAHGQPGHRCDIAVGAPLNSPAVKTTNTTTPTPVTTTSVATSTPSPVQPVAPGMNPAHGQPGHRCDIAVGAPLNSPATTTPTQAVQPVTPPGTNPVNYTVPAVKKDSSK